MTRVAILIDGGFFLKRLPGLGVNFPKKVIQDAVDNFGTIPKHPNNQKFIDKQNTIITEIIDALSLVLPYRKQEKSREIAAFHIKEILTKDGTQQDIRIAELHAAQVSEQIRRLVNNHLYRLNKIACVPNYTSLLYRCFFYDGRPFEGTTRKPVTRNDYDFRKTPEYQMRKALFDEIRRTPNFALRLGETSRDGESFWQLLPSTHKALLKGEKSIDDLTDDDFKTTLRQRAVDLRIGLDIATITLKRQANTLILVTGDSDFVPAAKLARREGCQVILDPLHQSVKPELFEHIDKLNSGFQRGNSQGGGANPDYAFDLEQEVQNDD